MKTAMIFAGSDFVSVHDFHWSCFRCFKSWRFRGSPCF